MEIKMKRFAAMILVVFAISFAFVGCQSAPEATQEETETPVEVAPEETPSEGSEHPEGGEHPEGSEHPEGN
jgi:starvation-inducible outer membrane lipoprotein